MVDNKTDNKRAAWLDTGEASKTTFDNHNSTKPDPVLGWHSLAANAKKTSYRQPKPNWKRNSQGWIDPLLTVHLGLLTLAALLTVGGKYA